MPSRASDTFRKAKQPLAGQEVTKDANWPCWGAASVTVAVQTQCVRDGKDPLVGQFPITTNQELTKCID
jgi:hypothetical protein